MSRRDDDGLGWADLLEQWRLIEADLFDAGVDMGDPAVLRRSWRWGEARIRSLFTSPPIGWREEPLDGGERVLRRAMFRYRIQTWAADVERRREAG